jgi:GNAT superfamily N-acetyltransferase
MIKNLKVDNVDCLHGTIVTVKNFNDFKDVFSVFREEPFYEDWQDDSIREQFDYLKENGEVLGYYTDRNIVGIYSMIGGAIPTHPVKFIEPEKVIYLSDIAIKKKYRGKGYAKDLVNFFMNYFENQDYYNEAYFRTNLVGSMSERLMLPYGFKPILDKDGNIITEDVSFDRTNDNLETLDRRKFLSKKRGENNVQHSRKTYFL